MSNDHSHNDTPKSGLTLYSLGIVVETKPAGSDVIMVTPIEHLSIQKAGDIKSQQQVSKGSLKGVNGKNQATKVQSSNHFRAKWLRGQGNQSSPPDVVANETVVLYKYADVDEYYWQTIFIEPTLRRQETVLYSYSNLKSGMTAFDKKTSYWFEVDTKGKKITLHTSNNDGEKTTYDIQLDTKSGALTIVDGENNYIWLDTPSGSVSVNTKKTINLVSGASINIKAPKINITGEVSTNGNSTFNGNSQNNGNITQSGSLNVNGNISASGSIMDGGGNSNHHSH